MIKNMLNDIDKIYMAYGATDFRKQIYSLCSIVINDFELDPYDKSAYIFCNKKRNSIKILCYDKNGFVLLQKRLLENERMKFQWPKNNADMKLITKEQLNWLLSGLTISPNKCFKEIEIKSKSVAI